MKIIKQGNEDKEYKYVCDLCGCEFTLTAEERACKAFASVRCPCCEKFIALSSCISTEAEKEKEDLKTPEYENKNPFKIGGIIYAVLFNVGSGTFVCEEGKIKDVYISESSFYVGYDTGDYVGRRFYITDIGKTIFFEKDLADRAAAEMSEESALKRLKTAFKNLPRE